MQFAGTVSWIYDVLCSVSFDDRRLTGYLPVATSDQSENGNAEKYNGLHQLPLHCFGSQLLSRRFHGVKLARNTYRLRKRILHWNNHTCWIDSPQLRCACKTFKTKTAAFFAWTFEKRHPLWQTLLSFFWPVLTLAICLFPVYPHRCKLIVLYSCAGILLMILSLLFVRAVAFGAMWILLGKRVWFFPNILAEEATLKELFRFWPKKDEEEPPKWTSRLFYTVVAIVVVMLLRRHAPDEAARARYQRRMSNIIDDVLEWSPKLALSGLMENQQPVNITDAANNSSDSAGGPDQTEEVDLDETQGEDLDETQGKEEPEGWTDSDLKT